MGIIFPNSQKYARSEKNRKSQIKQKISNSFEFNSNGLELEKTWGIFASVFMGDFEKWNIL